jgi:hypothetical protein
MNSGRASGGRFDPVTVFDGATVGVFELTVRFRDGTTAVFHEATPRSWRPGDRVMVIGRAIAMND